MNLLTCIFTENRCYKTGATIKPKGVMVHSTGANNPNLRRYVQPVSTTPDRAGLLARLGTNPNGNHWNRAGLNVCVHGFIGKLADSYKATIRKLMERGALRGRSDPDPDSLEDNVLNISEEYCRVMATLDKLGVLG